MECLLKMHQTNYKLIIKQLNLLSAGTVNQAELIGKIEFWNLDGWMRVLHKWFEAKNLKIIQILKEISKIKKLQ